MSKKPDKDMSGPNYEDYQDDFLKDVTDTPVDNKKRGGAMKGFLIAAICVVAVLVLIVGAGFGVYYLYDGGSIVDGVSVAGVDVGGMKMSEARDAVEAASEAYKSNDMAVTVLDTVVEIPAAYVRSLNVRGAVWSAYIYGNIGLPNTVAQQKQTAAASGYIVNLERFLKIDNSGLKSCLDIFDETYNTELVQNVYEIEGEKPSLQQIQDGTGLQTLKITLGAPDYTLDMDVLEKAVMDAYSRNTFSVSVPCDVVKPEPIDLKTILDGIYVAPVDASLDPETAEVVPSNFGYGFDLEEAQSKLDSAAYGTEFTFPFSRLDADLTTEELQAKLFRDKLSTYTAVHSSDSGRNTNLKLACAAVNGLVLKPGEVFSYNATLGERTRAKGYKAASAYIGGETVDTVGGGICQISSSLYYCALLADLEIVDRKNHGYVSSYMPKGMDATVSWPSLDFKFRNNMDYPIKIEAYSNGGTTTVSIYGTDERDYYVKMEYEVLRTIPYSVVYKTESAGSGYSDGKVLTTPYTGYDVKSYRCKYDKATDELISREFEANSNYRKRDKVVVRVEQPAAPSTPEGGGSAPDTPAA